MSVALPVRRWAAHSRIIDVALGAGVFAVDIAGQALVNAGRDLDSPSLGVVPVLLAAADAVPMLWRRQRPLLVLAVAAGVAAASAAAAEPGLLSQRLGVTLVITTFGVAAWSEHRRWATVLPALLLGLLVAGGMDDGSSFVEAGLAGLAAVGLPWATGSAARSRRLYVEEVERRLADAERDRDERARQAVIEERTHIARELHDVVAHHVSLIGVQAGAARTTLPPDGSETARAALEAIEEASRSAVGEMRRLLDILRSDDRSPETVPQPGLGELGRLVDGFRAAGIEVTTHVSRSDGSLEAMLDVCCYRVVEEALTNVARRSVARRAEVDVAADDEAVWIVVRDPGPALRRPVAERGSGRGLIGMAERVTLFGGELRVGPRPDGGFEVAAELPRGRR